MADYRMTARDEFLKIADEYGWRLHNPDIEDFFHATRGEHSVHVSFGPTGRVVHVVLDGSQVPDRLRRQSAIDWMRSAGQLDAVRVLDEAKRLGWKIYPVHGTPGLRRLESPRHTVLIGCDLDRDSGHYGRVKSFTLDGDVYPLPDMQWMIERLTDLRGNTSPDRRDLGGSARDVLPKLARQRGWRLLFESPTEAHYVSGEHNLVATYSDIRGSLTYLSCDGRAVSRKRREAAIAHLERNGSADA